jgi:ketosteroid isomerase-like protein
MSQENVEIVRRALDALNQSGVESIISSGLYSPEIVFDFSPAGIPGLGVYRGYDGIRAFEEDWFGAFPFEEWEIEVEELIDHRDQVIAILRQRGRGASSGVVTEIDFVSVNTLRGGEVARTEFYLDRKQALEAAGLRE